MAEGEPLTPSHLIIGRRTSTLPVQVVLVQEDGLSGSKWRIAKVLRSRDGETRVALVRVMNTKGKPSSLRRPIQKLYRLEVKGQAEEKVTEVEEPAAVEEMRRPPRRPAAIQADVRRRSLDQ